MGANNRHEDERVVYLALKDVFKDSLANTRKIKAIRTVFNIYGQKPHVAELFRRYDEKTVYDTVHRLLIDGVFASAEKARARFHGVPKPSPVLPEGHSAAEVNPVPDGRNVLSGNEAFDENLDALKASKTRNSIHASRTGTQLFPVRLPFPSQHKLMMHLQQLLEHACYGFATQCLPKDLQPQGCEFPEEIELNHWVDMLPKRSEVLQAKPGEKPLDRLCSSVANIRHNAVHRRHLTAAEVEIFFRDAEEFTERLGDTAATQTIALIRCEIQGTVEEIEENAQTVSSQLSMTMELIYAEREALRKREDEALSKMEQEHSKYQAIAARSLDAIIPRLEARPTDASDTEEGGIVTEDETKAGADPEGEAVMGDETMSGADLEGEAVMEDETMAGAGPGNEKMDGSIKAVGFGYERA
ncbi:hypothetical protein PG984_008345 [Apiospora sp. TS-2023a]